MYEVQNPENTVLKKDKNTALQKVYNIFKLINCAVKLEFYIST